MTLIWVAFVLATVMVPAAAWLHRSNHLVAARVVNIVALVLLFNLANTIGQDSQWLLGLMMFLGCMHLGLLMGWMPIRRP